MRHLEIQVRAKLERARRSIRAGDLTERGVLGSTAGGIRVGVMRRVRHIERIRLEGHLHALANLLRLRQRDIGVQIRGATHLADTGITDLVLGRCGEATGIEPFAGAADLRNDRTGDICAVGEAAV